MYKNQITKILKEFGLDYDSSKDLREEMIQAKFDVESSKPTEHEPRDTFVVRARKAWLEYDERVDNAMREAVKKCLVSSN